MDMEQMDVSRFMLFEATGDSEADADADAIIIERSASAGADGDNDNNDDDAESCSDEGSDSHDWDQGDQQPGALKSRVAHAEYEHRDGKMNDEEETAVYGTSYCDDDEIQKHQHQSSLSADSGGQQFMDETEKNRRFWEACLAS